jgi:hypothetical protein
LEDNTVYSTVLAYLLWFVGGFGALGLHRFYLGKFGTGLLYLFTGGLAAVGSIYDFFTLPMQVRNANLEKRYRQALDYGEPRDVTVERISRSPAREIGKDSIERVILKIAKKNSGLATPPEVALEGNIALDAAKKHLEQLVSRGFAEVRVSKTGILVYVFPDFTTDDVESSLEDF